MGEFELINLIQAIQSEYNIKQSPYINTAIGDDCAILKLPAESEFVVSTDTLINNVHFNDTLSAAEIGHKALAVNLSDIAAMAAQPIAATLNLTLPEIDQNWLTEFLHGFFSLAEKHQVTLVGGDTTKGPLSISVTINGIVENGKAIKRSTAQSDDLIYVSGLLGEAAFVLDNHAQDQSALHTPTPHIALGLALQGIANAMIDISDGLSSDLQHITTASAKGAIIHADAIPLGLQLEAALNRNQALEFALHGGEDYVLCFTVPKDKLGELRKIKQQFANIAEIGVITESPGLLLMQNNKTMPLAAKGYNHFNDR